MNIIIGLVFLLLVVTTVLIFKFNHSSKFVKNLIHISTYTNILATIIFIYNLLIKSSLGDILDNLGSYIVNGNFYIGFIIFLTMLNSLVLLSILFYFNLKNYSHNIDDKNIVKTSKIYSIFLYLLDVFFVFVPIIHSSYCVKVLNMPIEVSNSTLVILYSSLIFILLVFNILNIVIFNHFAKSRDIKQYLIKNLSEEDLKKIKKFNFGAFFLTSVWGLFNKTYGLVILDVVLGFIPIIGNFADLIMPFIFGFQGNKLAYENNYYDNVDDFNKQQKIYAIIGTISFAIDVIFILALLIFYTFVVKVSHIS